MQPEAPLAPPPQAPTPQLQPTPQPQTQPPQQGSGYDFIMNPPKPPKRSILPGGTTPIIRVAVVLVGLLILLIVFSVLKSLFTHSNTSSLVTVAQNQQEMIHITSNATQPSGNQQPNLTDKNKAFALTAQTSMTSAQSDLLAYMKTNGKKVKAKQLAATTSQSLDAQFTAAATNNTYDELFQQTMQNKLKSYEQALKVAYSQTSGPKGRALLSKDYDGAQLLLQELSQPGN